MALKRKRHTKRISGNAQSRQKTKHQQESITREQRVTVDSAYPESQRPIMHGLALAVIERAARLEKLIAGADSRLLLKRRPELDSVTAELANLGKWVDVPPRSETERLERNTASIDALDQAGVSLPNIVELAKAWGVRNAGRPATTRTVAVDALELKLRNPKKSWPLVTREVCNCGQPQHDRNCQERLRQQINDLRACLKKYGIVEPHPKVALPPKPKA